MIFKGNERLDLIHRLSTNQVINLKQNQGIKTILTNDKGRFVDLLTLYVFEDFVFAACSYGFGGKVKEHLNKYTIMDDFISKDMTGTHETILIFGKDVNNFTKDIFSIDLKKTINNDFEIIKEDNYDFIVSRNDDAFGGFIVIYPIELRENIKRKLFSNAFNVNYDLNKISDINFNNLRIEYGIPFIINEMNDLTNPLECGLNNYVNFAKGCYIGQEVIARLDTYDKVSKHLVGLKFENNDILKKDFNSLKILTERKECGYITSTAYSEKFGYIGLGFIKTISIDFKKGYFVKYENQLIRSTIHKLPFTQELET